MEALHILVPRIVIAALSTRVRRRAPRSRPTTLSNLHLALFDISMGETSYRASRNYIMSGQRHTTGDTDRQYIKQQ